MKSKTKGGRFLGNDEGQGPRGHYSAPLRYQKGQRDQDPIHNFTLDHTGARVWSF